MTFTAVAMKSAITFVLLNELLSVLFLFYISIFFEMILVKCVFNFSDGAEHIAWVFIF